MALKIIDHGSKEYQLMVQLRTDILRKPLGLQFSSEELDEEKGNVLIGAFEEDKMLGCCMLIRKSDQVVHLRQLAVLNNLQGKGIGKAILQFAENIARDLKYKKITMHARSAVSPFFEKLGYQIQGPEFQKLDLPHVEMEKQL
ncbi:MAG: GNAT family N-acetyltransferase [Chitinophagaceae bacterium]|jgi:N-acetylglutamate synthase-like GNAT family acetyltransferase|uniref:GNAT family N-acetyltransferase n=1 Tax=unclassified Paraflavitalea TaxID=2798305 RepID=UPI003D3343FB|nr:GNAT family N-acetyltransferase [Chitinophagaceae bacterium]